MKYFLLFIIALTAAKAADVTLAWDASPPPIVGYNFRTGIQPGTVLQSVPVGNVTTYTVSGLDYGTTYYFTVTAVNTVGESGPSNEVSYTPAAPAPDKIRYYPRVTQEYRMVGGIFEGTNGDPASGPYTAIYTVPVAPTGWTEVQVPLQGFRYLRYRGPANSYCNVAEIEFYRNGVKLTGPKFGTPGSYANNGNTFEKAQDNDINTRFDAPTADATNYTGIDTQ